MVMRFTSAKEDVIPFGIFYCIQILCSNPLVFLIVIRGKIKNANDTHTKYVTE